MPGEDLEEVVYRLIDPEQYQGKKVLVVGGGDAALEAALAICIEPGSKVTLSYRNNAFSRVKPKNRQLTEEAEKSGRLSVLLESNVKKIEFASVVIDQNGTLINLPNDAVIVCAGGILPTPLLKKIGIEVRTRHGTGSFDQKALASKLPPPLPRKMGRPVLSVDQDLRLNPAKRSQQSSAVHHQPLPQPGHEYRSRSRGIFR